MEMEGSPPRALLHGVLAAHTAYISHPFRPSHAPAAGGYRSVLFIPRPPHAMAHTAMLFCCGQTAVPALALRAEPHSCWYAFLPAVALCPLRRLSSSGCAVQPLPLTY
ncbi:uncharacterized protein LOC119322837 [Triticum dicoccoides]|uniref:uncharacterized protein LOC119322837 n=1 Tax=Triticum dicoccoides TaxID=85692 RepID=UPI0018915D11|nr:uncharacterized protein LOC119322837 [Triticum dicoccoides]